VLHIGMNDHFAIMSPDAAFDYFIGPFLSYYMKPLHEKFYNSETFIYHSYLELKLSLIATPKIFHLQKIRIDKDGSVIIKYVEELAYPLCGGSADDIDSSSG
jgi:hypothetical protein